MANSAPPAEEITVAPVPLRRSVNSSFINSDVLCAPRPSRRLIPVPTARNTIAPLFCILCFVLFHLIFVHLSGVTGIHDQDLLQGLDPVQQSFQFGVLHPATLRLIKIDVVGGEVVIEILVQQPVTGHEDHHHVMDAGLFYKTAQGRGYCPGSPLHR